MASVISRYDKQLLRRKRFVQKIFGNAPHIVYVQDDDGKTFSVFCRRAHQTSSRFFRISGFHADCAVVIPQHFVFVFETP